MADGAEPGGAQCGQALAAGKALGTELMFFDLREAVKAYEKRGKAA
jgi:hypothetical protein